MITAESILAAIDRRRVALAAQIGSVEPIPYTQVAAALGVHSAMFSRLKKGTIPTDENVAKLAAWVGSEEALHCAPCEALAEDGPEDDDDDDIDATPPGSDELAAATGAIVALLPAASDPIAAASSESAGAHMTTVWLGDASEFDELPIVATLLKEISLIASASAPVTASPRERGTLGSDGADVVFLDVSDAVTTLRDALLTEGSAVRALYDEAEQFPEWTPHVTLGYPDEPAAGEYDVDEHDEIVFDRIAVWIGEDRTEFALGGDEAPVYAINAVSGRLSESEDPETQAAVLRVRELLAEGAVGVSVLLDLHPDDAAIIGEAEKRAIEDADEGEWPDFDAYLPDGFRPRYRVRHTAVVDTPAFADARLSIDEAGTLSGPVTFEGIYTGDVRYASEPEQIDLLATGVPSPIIWDRADGDHTGMTVGWIDAFERVAAPAGTSGRPVLDDEAITAAFAPMEMPSAYFAQTAPTGPEPLRIGQPDARGYRPIRGLAAPKGICHRSSMKCWTWPGDKDGQHKGFHTGSLLRLDNGKDIRVGALTIEGAHLDPLLAKRGVFADKTGAHLDDARNVFALVRVWETKYGLMMAGAVKPGVPEQMLAEALACSPSVEFWPTGRPGERTLIGLHLVPTPALPVVASMGSAEVVVTDEPIVLEEALEDDTSDDEMQTVVAELAEFDMSAALAEALQPFVDTLAELGVKLDVLAETTKAILALTPIDDVEIPE